METLAITLVNYMTSHFLKTLLNTWTVQRQWKCHRVTCHLLYLYFILCHSVHSCIVELFAFLLQLIFETLVQIQIRFIYFSNLLRMISRFEWVEKFFGNNWRRNIWKVLFRKGKKGNIKGASLNKTSKLNCSSIVGLE